MLSTKELIELERFASQLVVSGDRDTWREMMVKYDNMSENEKYGVFLSLIGIARHWRGEASRLKEVAD